MCLPRVYEVRAGDQDKFILFDLIDRIADDALGPACVFNVVQFEFIVRMQREVECLLVPFDDVERILLGERRKFSDDLRLAHIGCCFGVIARLSRSGSPRRRVYGRQCRRQIRPPPR